MCSANLSDDYLLRFKISLSSAMIIYIFIALFLIVDFMWFINSDLSIMQYYNCPNSFYILRNSASLLVLLFLLCFRVPRVSSRVHLGFNCAYTDRLLLHHVHHGQVLQGYDRRWCRPSIQTSDSSVSNIYKV